jgi:hypothetical protein
MDLDRMMYLVVVNHRDGPFIPETELSRCSLVQVSKDIRDRQYTDVLAVLEMNPIGHICRDATNDFRDLIADADLRADRSRQGLPDLD